MIEVVKIPTARIPILIGKNKAVKRTIENKLDVKIVIDEDVQIEGEALNVMDAKNIILAIGRGFSPENAIRLMDEENTIAIIPISKNEKDLKRLKSRIIGEGGRARLNIENLTGTKMSIYGKTVSVIGKPEDVENVVAVIEMFIKGFSHRAVYAFLEKERTRKKYE